MAEQTYQINDRVTHQKWGSGNVIATRGSGEGLAVTIDFDAVETKELLVRYAPLTLEPDPVDAALKELGAAYIPPSPPRRLSDVSPSTTPTPPPAVKKLQWVDKSECDGCGPGNASDGVRLCEECTVADLRREAYFKSVCADLLERMKSVPDWSRRELRDHGVKGKTADLHGAVRWLETGGYLASIYIGGGQTRYSVRSSAKPKFESEPERMFWEANDRLGRPLCGLTAQHVVGRYRLDFALVDAKRAIEVDGLAWHNGQASFINDRERQRKLEMDGWRVLRFAAKEVMDDADACVRQAAEWASA